MSILKLKSKNCKVTVTFGIKRLPMQIIALGMSGGI